MNRPAVHMLFLSYRVRDRYASMPPIMLQFMLELPKPAMQGIKPQSRFYAQANATAAQPRAARHANGIPRAGAPLLFAVELCPPLVMVPDAVGPTSLAPPVLDACACIGFGTTVALGTAAVPVPISTTLLLVALKLVWPMDISLLPKSYTRYALLRKVSPRTAVVPSDGEMPKTQSGVPLSKVAVLPSGLGPGFMASSLIGTDILGLVKVKSRVSWLLPRRQSQNAVCCCALY